MRFLLVAALIMALIFPTAAQSLSHIGLWSGEDRGEVGFIEFSEDGYAYMVIKGDTLGGPSFLLYDHESSMEYVVDYTHWPFWVDFNIYIAESRDPVSVIKGIFLYTDDGAMRLCISFTSEERPATFNEAETLILKRVEED